MLVGLRHDRLGLLGVAARRHRDVQRVAWRLLFVQPGACCLEHARRDKARDDGDKAREERVRCAAVRCADIVADARRYLVATHAPIVCVICNGRSAGLLGPQVASRRTIYGFPMFFHGFGECGLERRGDLFFQDPLHALQKLRHVHFEVAQLLAPQADPLFAVGNLWGEERRLPLHALLEELEETAEFLCQLGLLCLEQIVLLHACQHLRVGVCPRLRNLTSHPGVGNRLK